MTFKQVIFFFFLPFSVFGQTDAPITEPKPIKSSIDMMLGVSYSYRHLRVIPDDTGIAEFIHNEREMTEQGRWLPRFGIHYNRNLVGNFWLKTGLDMSNLGYSKDVVLPTPIGEQQTTKRVNVDYWFITLPVAARYEFHCKKISPFVEIGSSFCALISPESDAPFIANKSKFLLESFVSLGASYRLNKDFALFTQPIFRYYTNLAKREVPISENLWNAGFEFGLRRYF